MATKVVSFHIQINYLANKLIVKTKRKEKYILFMITDLKIHCFLLPEIKGDSFQFVQVPPPYIYQVHTPLSGKHFIQAL